MACDDPPVSTNWVLTGRSSPAPPRQCPAVRTCPRAAALLAHRPDVRIFVTSRGPLRRLLLCSLAARRHQRRGRGLRRPRLRSDLSNLTDVNEIRDRSVLQRHLPITVRSATRSSAAPRSSASPQRPASTAPSSTPTPSYQNNCSSTTSCAKRQGDVGVERFVHISTDEVYHSVAEGWFREATRAGPATHLALQGRQRPHHARRPGTVLRPAGDRRLVEQLRPAPVSRRR